MTPLSPPRLAAIDAAIHLAYREAGRPLPVESEDTVTPLDALLSAFPLCAVEVAGLSSRSAAAYLQRLAPALCPAPPVPGADDEALAGFLFAARVQGEAWGCVLVERSHIIERRRFSAAHELGHYLLHFCPLIEGAGAMDYPTFLEGLAYRSSAEHEGEAALPAARLLLTDAGAPGADPRAQMEREANAFAAALLMPAVLCRRLIARYGGGVASAKHLATQLLVSPAAMRVRLLDLGLLTPPAEESWQ